MCAANVIGNELPSRPLSERWCHTRRGVPIVSRRPESRPQDPPGSGQPGAGGWASKPPGYFGAGRSLLECEERHSSGELSFSASYL